ncbi:MAG: carotenoid oxygenase family protein [Pseudomonadota bacterium]
MHRRTFIQGGLALASMPLLARGGEGTSTAPAHWSLGWQGVSQDAFAPKALTVSGRLPAALQGGALYRNGPARLERAGVRYRHWFDGDGMLQRFRIGAESIVHDGRFIQTPKYQEEQAAGRFLYNAAGTELAQAIGSRNNDSGNVANTALLPWDDELLALWEGGSAYRLDPDSLETLGRKDWSDELQHMPFSAHPLRERDGTLWNVGSAPYAGKSGTLFVYRISGDGTVIDAQPITTQIPGYLHSFAMSDRYLMFYLGPHVFEHGGNTFVDSFRWTPDLGSRVLVVDKDDLSQQQWFEAPPGFAFHCADAWQEGSDVVMRLCLYDDASVMHSGMFALLERSENALPSYPAFARASMATVRASTRDGRLRVDSASELMEFPVTDGRATDGASPVFGVGHGDASHPTFSNAVIRVMPRTGEVERFVFGERRIVEEPLFVPQGGIGEGWLIGTFLDLDKRRSGVYVLDAARLAEGPVALASMDRILPLGFHGCFTPRTA